MLQAIYLLHSLFWVLLAIGWFTRPRQTAAARPAQTSVQIPRAGLYVAMHGVGFTLMYLGLGDAIFRPGGAPFISRTLQIAGAIVILLGGCLGGWSIRVFHSWKFGASIEKGHMLCTSGPFAWIRNPIYAAIDMLSLGSFMWTPTMITLIALLATGAAGDLRGRIEEKSLSRAFGQEYEAYRLRVKRLIPGVY